MAEERVQRRVAAVLAADVVGYSRLMEADEQGTLEILKARRRDVLAPLIARSRGRVVKVMGDSVLVEFASAVDAVQCAVDLQCGTAEANDSLPDSRRVILRIGINLGDIIMKVAISMATASTLPLGWRHWASLETSAFRAAFTTRSSGRWRPVSAISGRSH